MDGPGIRTTVFFKGCNLQCAWCHNPEGQASAPQMMLYTDVCIGCGRCRQICASPEACTLCGKCVSRCPVEARKVCGKEYAVDDVLAEVMKDKAFYDNSGGGVTFSGGECMLQIEFLTDILKRCKANGIHTAVDTAGHVPFQYFERVLPYTDLFLYDIKCFDSQKHRKYVGVGNELILDNLKRLLKLGVKVWIRIPIVAHVNDSVEELRHIKAFLTACGKVQKVELLPYHAMGENKCRSIGKIPRIFETPDKEKLERLAELFA